MSWKHFLISFRSYTILWVEDLILLFIIFSVFRHTFCKSSTVWASRCHWSRCDRLVGDVGMERSVGSWCWTRWPEQKSIKLGTFIVCCQRFVLAGIWVDALVGVGDSGWSCLMCDKFCSLMLLIFLHSPAPLNSSVEVSYNDIAG